MIKAVITGANGQLGMAFRQEFARRGADFWACDHLSCDITNKEQIGQILDSRKPSVLINCAAYNLVDEAQNNRSTAFEVNAEAVKILAQACHARGIKFIHYSTDYVFDGRKDGLYTEDDAVRPLNVYGLSKYEGEVSARTIIADYLIFRTSWVYGEGKHNFLHKVSEWAVKSKVLKIAADEVSVPTYVDDIVLVTLKAMENGLTGLYHLTSSGYASRYELAKYFLKAAGLEVLVIPVPISQFQSKTVRPLFSAMSNQKISGKLGIQIPCWQAGIEKYVSLKGRLREES